jgi:hypothetical protein
MAVIINWKGYERKQTWPDLKHYPSTYLWGDWAKPQKKTPVRILSVLIKIQNRHVSSEKSQALPSVSM